MNPPVLPWHREAADLATAAYDRLREDKGCRIIDDIAAIIARHDPYAAQHAETVRLLGEAVLHVKYSGPARLLHDEIRAHLAALHIGGGNEMVKPITHPKR